MSLTSTEFLGLLLRTKEAIYGAIGQKNVPLARSLVQRSGIITAYCAGSFDLQCAYPVWAEPAARLGRAHEALRKGKRLPVDHVAATISQSRTRGFSECIDPFQESADAARHEQQLVYVNAMSQTPPDWDAAAEALWNISLLDAYSSGLGGSSCDYGDSDHQSFCESGYNTYEKCQLEG